MAPATGKKRPLSAEGVALEIATHANHFSTNPQNLLPVDPARRLPSSPDPLTLTHSTSTDPSATPTASQQPGQRSAKKHRSSSSSEATSRDAPQAQTATPPPSSRGGRKLAPKLQTDIMQHQNFAQPDFSNAPSTQHPQINTAFVTGSPEDVFGYPMGPATAPPITGPRLFWGMDMDTTGMALDVDISAAGAEIFQSSQTQGASHQTLNSLDWGSANQVFQQTNVAGQQQQQQSQVQAVQQNQSTRRERPLAPKTVNTSSPKFSQTSPGQNYSFGSFQMSMDDPFNTSPGGVDPGLLFSQHSSLSMPLEPSPQRPSSSAPLVNPGPDESSAPMPKSDIRRSKSTGAQGQRNVPARPPAAISPTKSSAAKPGLSRSFSESARSGKRTVGSGRPILPTLAPAPVAVHQPSLPPTANQSNALTQTRVVRSGGRRSPVKSSHHHRLSSLTSIPENTSRTQARQRSAKLASVKFVIDEDGRARTETVVDDDDDDNLEPVFPSSNQPGSQRSSWAGFPVKPDVDEDEGSSSSDDEPIIIPSRNTSFNFPEPPRSSASMSRPPTAASNTSQNRRQRSVSERSSFSSTSFRRNPRNGPAASLADQMEIDQQEPPPPPPTRPSTGGSLGDAAAELRKVMQAGTSKRPGAPAQVAPPTGSGGSSGHRQRFTPGQRSSSSTISATPSPTHNQSQGQVRCVCNRPEAEVDGLLHLIKWYVEYTLPPPPQRLSALLSIPSLPQPHT